MHVALADAQLAHGVGAGEGDVRLGEDGARQLDAVVEGDGVALGGVEGLVGALAEGEFLGADGVGDFS